MKSKVKLIKILSFLIAVLFILSACVNEKTITAKYSRNTAIFNTMSTFYVYDDFTTQKSLDKYETVWQKAQNLLLEIENTMSSLIESSDISKFNELSFGESVKISNMTAEVIKIAKTAYELTDGYFDPTVYPLVDLWGFTPRFSESVFEVTEKYDRERNFDGSYDLPDEKYISAFTKLIGFDKVELSGNESDGYFLTKNIPSVVVDGITYNAKIDLGGIAKGYACDIVSRLMTSNDYYYGYFSCGTSSIALLKSGSKNATDEYFQLGIKKPRSTNIEGDTYLSVLSKDISVSSSGDYEKYYKIDGKIYCHIISPKTGYPLNVKENYEENISTVTLLSDNAALLDALSTAVTLMPIEKAKTFLAEKLPSYKAFIVTTINSDLFVWTNQTEGFTITDQNYNLK